MPPWLEQLLGLATGPGGQFLASLFASGEQAGAQEDYETNVDQLMEQLVGQAFEGFGGGQQLYREEMQPAIDEMTGLQNRVMGGAEDLSRQTLRWGRGFLSGVDERGDDLMSGYRGDQASFLEELSGREQSILGGYGGRYAYAQDQLSQLGGQGRADINRMFDEEQARSTLDLQQRGLLSSSEAARGGYDVTERRSAELRRFEEDLARERIGTLSALSGEGLGAEERLGAQHAGYQYGGQQTAFQGQAGLDAAYAAYERAVRGDVLGAEQNILNYDMQTGGAMADLYGSNAANLTNLYRAGNTDVLNALGSINYQPPQQSNLSFMYGQNAVQPVQAPSSWEMMMPGAVSGSGNVLGSLILASALSGGGGAAGALPFAAMPSDRDLKEDIRHQRSFAGLTKVVARLPLYRWRYKGDTVEHLGPMAQDFYAAFGVGTDTTIHPIDVAGVLIASVQALYAELRELRQEIKQGAVAA